MTDSGRAERARAVVDAWWRKPTNRDLDSLTELVLEFGQGEAERAERDGYKRLHAELDRYGRHDSDCQLWKRSRPSSCSCGFSAVMEQAIRARESQPVAPATCPRCGVTVETSHVCVPEPVAPAEPWRPKLSDRHPMPWTPAAVAEANAVVGRAIAQEAEPGAAPLSPSPPTETPERECAVCHEMVKVTTTEFLAMHHHYVEKHGRDPQIGVRGAAPREKERE